MIRLVRIAAPWTLGSAFGILLLAARPSPRPTFSRNGTYCIGPDSFSTRQIDRLQSLVRSTDAAYVAFRQSVHIPAVTDTAVKLVTADSICSRAVQAWAAGDSALGAPPPYETRLYLLSVGAVYVATPAPVAGIASYQQYVVYDSNFVQLAPFLW